MNNIYRYLNEKNLNTSNEVNKKTKIYLDTKYWIEICDVLRGVKKNEDIQKIYLYLREGVQDNKLICPISQPIFKEVLKQNDEESLKQTLKIMDELSHSIIICHDKTIFTLELYNFFYDNLQIEIDRTLSKNFWCKSPVHMYGIKIRYFQNLTNEENFLRQKNYFDKVEKYTFLNYIAKLSMDDLKMYRDSKIDTNWFEQNKQKNINEYNTFDKLYMAEIFGTINDWYKNDIKEIFNKVVSNISEKEKKSFTNENISDEIYKHFKQKKMNLYLPSLDIGSMLHAKFVWNKTQKYKQGDMDDIRHAIIALPYYNYFFTEKSLHNMIKECNYDEKYSCVVASKNKQIIDILEKLNC